MALNFSPRSDASATRAYYLRSDELLPGAQPVLLGKGWQRLGVAEFTEAGFRRLTDGLHPDTGRLLTQRVKQNRIDGWDATFNAPKTISLAIEFAPGGERLRQAGLEALQETFAALVEPSARVRYQDADKRPQSRFTGELLAVAFPHALARPQDGRDPLPHAHWHVYIANWTHDPVRNKGYALNTLDMQKHLPSVESDWHRRYRAKVEAMGFKTVDNGRYWDLGGIPRRTVTKFSERRAAIEKLLAAKEFVSGKLRDAVGLITRDGKERVEPETLRDVWRARLTEAEARAFRTLERKPKQWRGPRRSHARHLAFVQNAVTLAAEQIKDHIYERR